MDAVIGFTGKDFTMIGADQNAGRSLMIFQQDLDKIVHLDSHKILGVAGDPADTVFEPEYFQKNVDHGDGRTAAVACACGVFHAFFRGLSPELSELAP